MTDLQGYLIAFLSGMVVMAILQMIFGQPRYYRHE
jgi:hypothetical protein